MKKIFILFILAVFTIQLKAQTTKVLFTTPEITWYGLDFSKSIFIGSFAAFGDAGLKTGQQLKDQYFKGWNDLIIRENEKYNFKTAYNKTTVPYDLSIVSERNESVNADKLFSEKSSDKNLLTKEDIASMVKDYKTLKKGLGLVYIVDNFDKPATEGVIWVTFFDSESKNILYTEKFVGTPKGFGIKNFWAGAILEVIKKSSKEFKNLQKPSKK